ncbi:hypothetical protein BH11BAC5_BH11BAC5_07620 [soil metagenome]|jgi:hypothetical protein
MNKTNISKLMACVFVCAGLLLACKKDDNPAPPTPDKVKKLLYDWKITSITTPKTGQPATDSSILKACVADDIIKFSNNGFDFQDGTNKCDSSLVPYWKGSWVYDLNKDSIQLHATTPAKYLSWKVTTLNDSIMKVTYTDSLNPEKKIVKTISFKH